MSTRSFKQDIRRNSEFVRQNLFEASDRAEPQCSGDVLVLKISHISMKRIAIGLIFVLLTAITIVLNVHFSGPEFNGRSVVLSALAMSLLRPRRPWLWAAIVWGAVEIGLLLRLFPITSNWAAILSGHHIPKPNLYVWLFLPCVPALAAAYLGTCLRHFAQKAPIWIGAMSREGSDSGAQAFRDPSSRL
jgi:hypothetical protein